MNNLSIGDNGAGVLEIADGGHVFTKVASIATGIDTTGTVRVIGDGSRFEVELDRLFMGRSNSQNGGTALLEIGEGAMVRLPFVEGGSKATIRQSGGALVAGPILSVRLEQSGGTAQVERMAVLASAHLSGDARLTIISGYFRELSVEEDAVLELTGDVLGVSNTPYVAVVDMVLRGRAGESWDGPGIISPVAAEDPRLTLAVVPYGAGAEVRLALIGDANFSGQVSISDLGVLAANWQQSGRYWFHGDFNYDGIVNIADLGMLAGNWQAGVAGSGAGGMSFAEAMAMFDVFDGVVVPEPAAVGVLMGLGLLMLRRRQARG